jgi:hypothetical protein
MVTTDQSSGCSPGRVAFLPGLAVRRWAVTAARMRGGCALSQASKLAGSIRWRVRASCPRSAVIVGVIRVM